MLAVAAAIVDERLVARLFFGVLCSERKRRGRNRDQDSFITLIYTYITFLPLLFHLFNWLYYYYKRIGKFEMQKQINRV